MPPKLHFLSAPRDLEDYSLVILPGSKATLADLAWLRQTGWERALADYRQGGGKLLGICGGFQMMGQTLSDPEGLEGPRGTRASGLGWVPMETQFSGRKTVIRTQGKGPMGAAFTGYEIHQGKSRFTAPQRAWLQLESGPEGWAEPGLWGTYQHGLFDSLPFLARFLKAHLGLEWEPGEQADPFDRLAAAFAPYLDLEAIVALLQGER